MNFTHIFAHPDSFTSVPENEYQFDYHKLSCMLRIHDIQTCIKFLNCNMAANNILTTWLHIHQNIYNKRIENIKILMRYIIPKYRHNMAIEIASRGWLYSLKFFKKKAYKYNNKCYTPDNMFQQLTFTGYNFEYWPLRHAIVHGHLHIVKHLCDDSCGKYLDIQSTSVSRLNPHETVSCMLSECIKWNRYHILKYLLSSIPNIQHKCNVDELINEACRYARMRILKMLIARSEDTVCSQDSSFQKAFEIACLYGRLNIVKYLLEAENTNIDFMDALKRCNYKHIAQYLLTKYHIENVQQFVSEALCIACEIKNYGMVKFWISKGADVTFNNNNALCINTRQLHNWCIMKCLIRRGADVNANYNTPLINAIEIDDYAKCEYLIYHGANLNIDYTIQPLEYVCRDVRANLHLVKYMIQHGANIHNSSALCELSNNVNKLDIIKYLVDIGMSVYYGNPMRIACRNKNLIVVKYFANLGVWYPDILHDAAEINEPRISIFLRRFAR